MIFWLKVYPWFSYYYPFWINAGGHTIFNCAICESAVVDLSPSLRDTTCLWEDMQLSTYLNVEGELFCDDFPIGCFNPFVWNGWGMLELVWLLILFCAKAFLWLVMSELTPLANCCALLDVEVLDNLGEADLCPVVPLVLSLESWGCRDATEWAGLDCLACFYEC